MSDKETTTQSSQPTQEPCHVDLLNETYKRCAALQFNRWKYPEKFGGEPPNPEECTDSFEAWRDCYIEKMTGKKR